MTKAMTCRCLLAAGLLASGTAQAALFDRGGGLIYDDVLDITWLQDANYAQTSGYDSDGRMTWAAAMTWANNLVYGGYDDWRLPFVVDTATGGCDFAFSGTDCGFNVQTASGGTVYSELASLWYDTLGNRSFFDTAGNYPQTGWGLSNTGPFTNLPEPFTNFAFNFYWSGTAYAPATAGLSWGFLINYGGQDVGDVSDEYFAWAVRPGDVAAALVVSEPGSLALAGLALGGLAGGRRRGRFGA